MARVMKTCRVCGEQYEACHTPNTSGVFRWRDVACSRECGKIYLERVMESRKEPSTDTTPTVITTDNVRTSDLTDID